MISSENLAFEVDVWNVVENELNTGLLDVLDMSFNYKAGDSGAKITIRHPKGSRIETKRIELDREATDNLVIKLAKRFNFNFQWFNVAGISFWLIPGDLPLFNVDFYPCVTDPSTLDGKKSRMNMLTID